MLKNLRYLFYILFSSVLQVCWVPYCLSTNPTLHPSPPKKENGKGKERKLNLKIEFQSTVSLCPCFPYFFKSFFKFTCFQCKCTIRSTILKQPHLNDFFFAIELFHVEERFFVFPLKVSVLDLISSIRSDRRKNIRAV